MEIEYYNYLINHVKLRPFDSSLSSNEKQNIECLLCGSVFNAIVKGKVANYKKHGMAGCSKCTSNERYKDVRLFNIERIKNKFSTNVKEIPIHDPKIEVTNNLCKHTFTVNAKNILSRNVNCPICNNEIKSKLFKKYNEEKHKISLQTKSKFKQYCQKVNILTKISYKNNIKTINPSGLIQGISKENYDTYHVDHIISKKICFLNNIPEEVCANYQNLRMLHWKDNNKKHSKADFDNIPEIFMDYFNIAYKTQEFIDFLKCNIQNIETNNIIVNNKKLTAKIGKYYILYCTFDEYRYQNQQNKYVLYNLNKSIDNLLIIFEDEFINNKDILLSKLKHILIDDNNKTIYARKTSIKEISYQDKVKFLKTNHIQGACNSKINLGAYYNDVLIAVMTFSKPRILMSKNINKNAKDYELVRFATDINYKIIGVAGKLLAYFKNNFDWNSIYSYADKRWSKGNLYEKLGFKMIVNNQPEYYYIINGRRKHRWGFRKDAIKQKFPNVYNLDKTEYEMMIEIGIDKIYDCGTLKYQIINNIK